MLRPSTMALTTHLRSEETVAGVHCEPVCCPVIETETFKKSSKIMKIIFILLDRVGLLL